LSKKKDVEHVREQTHPALPSDCRLHCVLYPFGDTFGVRFSSARFLLKRGAHKSRPAITHSAKSIETMTFKLPSIYENQEGLFQQRSGFSPQGTPPFARRNRVVDRARVVGILSDALELMVREQEDKTGNDEAVKDH
jgi:hypothetical protein